VAYQAPVRSLSEPELVGLRLALVKYARFKTPWGYIAEDLAQLALLLWLESPSGGKNQRVSAGVYGAARHWFGTHDGEPRRKKNGNGKGRQARKPGKRQIVRDEHEPLLEDTEADSLDEAASASAIEASVASVAFVESDAIALAELHEQLDRIEPGDDFTALRAYFQHMSPQARPGNRGKS